MGRDLSRCRQPDHGDAQSLHHKERGGKIESREPGAAGQVGGEQREARIGQERLGQESRPQVEIVVAQGAGVDAGGGIKPVGRVHLKVAGAVADQRVEDAAHRVVAGGEGQHPRRGWLA